MFNGTLRQVGDGAGTFGWISVKEVGANHSLLYKQSIDVYGYTVHIGMMKAITQ